MTRSKKTSTSTTEKSSGRKPRRKSTRTKSTRDEDAAQKDTKDTKDTPRKRKTVKSDVDKADAVKGSVEKKSPSPRSRGGGRKQTSRKASTSTGRSRQRSAKSASKPDAPVEQVMIVNDIPGEECRIAMLEHGVMEGIHSEHAGSTLNVGNIYKGRVVNVHSSVQAAFIDYGQGANGFLHITDLHPRYFPGKTRKEQIGKKIPRRERPLMQDCLKVGDDVTVQVLREGVGSKGPTLSSYLSIPGRFLVLMPDVGHVGVSRKAEDLDQRREMREILDTIDLPEGFGFILRTAGLSRTKLEIKRDIAYLMRLWKVMDKRMQTAGTPCELYIESDVLIRTIRDVLNSSTKMIVIDSEQAYERVTSFMKVISPRSGPDVIRYHRTLPIFHAFDIERQIDLIHEREVPLPSGGSLVIEQTEAMVVIDVNSGRSRKATDSETNAYRTNCEAVDEICRQLRLRDLGGIVVCDLIDMRMHSQRKEIVERFEANTERDRARTTIGQISEFGLLELTRQRMRPGIHKATYISCPECLGHGHMKSSEAVAADVIRKVAFLLYQEQVHAVEIVVATGLATSLLSGRRTHLNELEAAHDKKIEVRVSEDIPTNRVDYYVYDSKGSDINIDRLRTMATPTAEELHGEHEEHGGDSTVTESEAPRQRKRKRGGGPADASEILLSDALAEELRAIDEEEEKEDAAAVALAKTKEQKRDDSRTTKARASVQGRQAQTMRVHALARELGVTSRELIAKINDEGTIVIRNHMSSVSAEEAQVIRTWHESTDVAEGKTGEAEVEVQDDAKARSKPRRRRRRRGGRGRGGRSASRDRAPEADASDTQESAPVEVPASESGDSSQEPKRRRRRRGGRGRGRRRRPREQGDTKPAGEQKNESKKTPREDPPEKKTTAPRRKSLYRSRRTISPQAREQ